VLLCSINPYKISVGMNIIAFIVTAVPLWLHVSLCYNYNFGTLSIGRL